MFLYSIKFLLRLGSFTSAILLAIVSQAQTDCKSTKGNSAPAGVMKGGSMELWPMDILHQKITLDLTVTNVISASCEVTAVPRSPDQDGIGLHLLGLTVDSVISSAGSLDQDHVGELLTIHFGSPLSLTDTVTFTVHYHGDPATDPSGFGGFYTTSSYIYNLGVAFESLPHSYGRVWFPCVDNFTERNTYEFIVRTNGGKSAWCNGELLSEEQIGDTLIRHWSKDLAIPAYLASVSAAEYISAYDTIESINGDQVPIVLSARQPDINNMVNSFAGLPAAFDLFESWFGRFRWQKVGYVLTPIGAMEHSTSIHFPASIVDGSLDPEDIMAHELAHEWFGNLVTCERPEEMYLNEGFAEYLSFLFFEAVYGRDRYMRIVRNNHRKMVHQAQLLDEGWWPLADVPQQWTYGEHSYNKGADVIHSLRGYLGDSLFRSGLTSFLDQHEFQPVNSIMLRDHLTAATGMDMTDFFADHIFQPGWAAFEVDSFHVNDDLQTTLYLQQKLRGANEFFNNVPLSVTCVNANGERWRSADRILAGDEYSIATIDPPFEPQAIILNEDELIGLAMTADEDTLVQNGSISYPLSNFRVTVEAIDAPLPIRIEQYWVAADQIAEDDFIYEISPDRWWRVIADIPSDSQIDARIEYDGRASVNSSLDLGLMQNAGSISFHEDSLVLLYREDQHAGWIPHPEFTIQTLGNPTDKWGRIDFSGLRAGEYTLGWRKSAVSIPESLNEMQWTIYPNPAQDRITIETELSDRRGTYELLDRKGRMIRWEPCAGAITNFPLHGTATGLYELRFRGHNGRSVRAGRLSIVK